MNKEMECSRSQPSAEGSRAEPSAAGGWRPTTEAPAAPGVHINVRSVTTYRWLPYKPKGARQMRKAGRWQRFNGYGFENAELPENAEWTLNEPLPPKVAQ